MNYRLLPTERVGIAYNLITLSYDRVRPEKKGHLAEKNFIIMMPYKNAY